MKSPFEGDGVPEELQKLLSGARILGAEEGPPDPRRLPITYEDVHFRNTYHRWVPVQDPAWEEKSGKPRFLMFNLEIIDVARGKVYHYGLAPNMVDQLELQLKELRKVMFPEESVDANTD